MKYPEEHLKLVELLAGANHREPTKADMDKNIEALHRCIEGKPLVSDFVLLNDTISILEGIKAKLPCLQI